MPSPPAEFVFLLVALAKVFLVRETYLIQTVPADVHAEPHSCWHVHVIPSIQRGAEPVQVRCSHVLWDGIVLAEPGVTADGGVIGKRCRGANVFGGIGGPAKPMKPVGVHLG